MDNLIAVSSWSLHRTIGVSYPDSPLTGPGERTLHSETWLDLLELPAELKANGYTAMQLCHFHLPSRDEVFAAEFRAALRDADVELLTVLIDEGDVTHPEHGELSAKWIAGWVETASELGASRARVIAGKQPYSKDAMNLAVTRLKSIASRANEIGVQLETENWFGLLSTPSSVNELLDRMEGDVRLCADFGNWSKADTYQGLPAIMPRAETCHAKFEFLSAKDLDEAHAQACLQIAFDAEFAGPLVLVNGGRGESDWEAMDIQRQAIRGFEPQ